LSIAGVLPTSASAAWYGNFVAENPAFFHLTAQRVTSYWNCYNRFRYPVRLPAPDSKFDEYPGFSLISALRSAGHATGS
jgi:hypothetical protein